MPGFLSDLRFTARQLVRQPGYAVAAVLILGLAIGATTTTFSVVNAIVLRPLPFPAAPSLVTICERHPSIEGFCIASPPDVEDWRARSAAFQQIGLARDWSMRMSVGERAEDVYSGIATGGFFAALGIQPALGRLIGADEYGPDHRVVLLSDALWRSRFDADPRVVGRGVLLDGKAAVVVGVLPAHTDIPHLEGIQLWASLPFDPRDEENRKWRGFKAVARLASGTSRAAAGAELVSIANHLADEHPATNRGWSVEVVDLRDSLVGDVRARLFVFLGAVGLVLLLGCANLAGLMLARTANREHEFAVRRAIGATQGRLARLLLTESLVLSLTGGALGVLLASWGVQLFIAIAPPGLPRLDEVTVDSRALLVALGLSGLTAILIGGVPALRGGKAGFTGGLHASRVVRRGSGGMLVIAEIAIAVMMLAGAALLGRRFARLTSWDPGFDRHALVVTWTSVSQSTYPNSAAVSTVYAQALDAVRALPGVASASLASGGPLFGGEEPGTARALRTAADSTVVLWRDVGPAYFTTLGIPLRAGRDFTLADRAGQPMVAIVNETAARRLWAGRPPLGEHFAMIEQDLELTVVGVVSDVPSFRPDAPVRPEVYWPYFQQPRWGAYIVIRTEHRAGLVAPLRERLRNISAELEPTEVTPLDDLVGQHLVTPRFNALLLGAFASVALLLATVGIAGLIAYRVSRRVREIGVRLALGATTRNVVVQFVREGSGLVAAGVLMGIFGAVLVTRLLGSMLAGISPTDPATFAAVIAVVLSTGLAAAWLPARRASRVNPLDALRAE